MENIVKETTEEKHIAHPVKSKNRIIALDVLRGVAVLGILLMNILGFGMITNYDSYLTMINEPLGPNFITYAVTTILFEGKMRALFCILFGAGIMLFLTQKASLGKIGLAKLHYTRMFWLIIFGLIHSHLLLWKGDILYFYGVFGMIVYLLRNLNPKIKAIGVPLVAIIGFIISIFFYQGFREKRLNYVDAKAVIANNEKPTEKQLEDIKTWKKTEKNYVMPPDETARIESKMLGTYSDVASEIRPKAFEVQTKYLIVNLSDSLALMLLGMAMLQWGFFTGKWTNKQYKTTAIIGYSIGLPLVLFNFYYDLKGSTTLELIMQNLENTKIPWINLIYPFQRIFLSFAHAALIILFAKSPYLSKLKMSLKAVGQMALTNYVLQTICCTLFFFGYGLGYYNTLEYYQLFYVVLAVWLLELIISPIWLKYFKFGPLEWLWRSLTYRRFQPMRRVVTTIPANAVAEI